jgi:phage-related minor tail protein
MKDIRIVDTERDIESKVKSAVFNQSKMNILRALLELQEQKSAYLTNATKLIGLPPGTPIEVLQDFRKAADAWKTAASICDDVIDQLKKIDEATDDTSQ